ncbi:polyribonucleotide nucleotidyltransferase [Patescibacteria group bacterium]|nr:polyribonucleotide nucleotidyltransferase [Patescibacteria group bacterium]MBU4162075.1 polyribonucleotide nucleotidyltransferase [Patescibacteria group bacterium]
MKFNKEIGGKNFEVEIDTLAEQANGSIFVRMGDTLVMATATMSPQDLEGLNFFPLTVEFQEKFYATGKILGSRFMRREGRPSEESILTSRLIDRCIRPLFPDDLKREVQIIVSCYSFDKENDPDIPGVMAASLALGISDIPWNGPIAPIRVAKVDNNLILNPNYEDRGKGHLEIMLSGVQQGKNAVINMIEAQANEAKENEIFEATEFAEKHLGEILDFQKEIIAKAGKEKIQIEKESNLEIAAKLKESFSQKLEDAMTQPLSLESKRAMQILENEIIEFTKENFGEEKIEIAKRFIEKELTEILHNLVLEKGKRPDGRKLDEVRKIDSMIEILPRAHGSAVFIRGTTKALSSVTLGPPGDQRLIEGMEISGKQRFMHHYNFPPYCSGEVKPLRGPGRREIGHGMLAEKALLPLIPKFEDFPYTIRIVTEILSSNGSTSMASVSAASLALMDAGVPIKNTAAGIAIGLIKSDNDYRLLTDIQGPEDHSGDMDFKVAGTLEGITAIQMDVKINGIDLNIIKEALEKAKHAREQIIKAIHKTIAKPKPNLSPYAPKIFRIKINPEKIGAVIGTGGKVINEIIDVCGVTIDIEDDGNVFISAESEEAAKKAIDWVEGLTREVVVGEIFQGKVVKILDFGAFVEILPGKDGLVHISELEQSRVNKVDDVVKLGDIIPVKVISVDDQGRINLSKKQAQAQKGGKI